VDTTLSDASDYDQTVHAVRLQITEEHPLSVSSKLPPLRPWKSRPLRRKRRKARSPGLKGITLTSSLLLDG
jgi:hypothetical protein